jgi:hypothetical protein
MEKRNHMIMVRLTEDEWKELQAKCLSGVH